jgi:predicted membrane protein
VSDQNKFDPDKLKDDIRGQVRSFQNELQDHIQSFKDELHETIHSSVQEGVNMGADKQDKPRKQVVIGIHLGKSCEGQWGIFSGVLIALIGLVILLDNLNIVAASHLVRFWPLIVVAFGLLYLLGRSSRLWGWLLVIFGALLQLDKLQIIHLTWGIIWGLAWIAVGVVVMWGSLVARKLVPSKSDANDDPKTSLSENVVFGGIERRLTTKDFRGGVATAIFGGIELDLSEADMQQDEARLEVNAIFGGVELRVPYNWQVVSRGIPVFGGFVDKTRVRDTVNGADSKRKVLVLTGSAIFGGVDVKN